MAPSNSQQTLLSPVELDFLSSSLRQQPPVRLDLRGTTEFRPLVAETDVLSSAYGSARVCLSDGTEAIAGVKAELERTQSLSAKDANICKKDTTRDEDSDGNFADGITQFNQWLTVTIDIPGFRDDDALPVFLASMLTEALLANSTIQSKLKINDRWHWKLFIDVLSLSPPLSYPLPLLSFTTHLALLDTALPRLKSDPNDDPLFDDDWAAAVPLFTRDTSGAIRSPPPITILVLTIGDNIVFDPTGEELAVADNVVAVSYAAREPGDSSKDAFLELLSLRLIDAPSRMTVPGSLLSLSNATNARTSSSTDSGIATTKTTWKAPSGGLRRPLLTKILGNVLKQDGIGSHVLDSISSFVN